jgi:hypothetical protein
MLQGVLGSDLLGHEECHHIDEGVLPVIPNL